MVTKRSNLIVCLFSLWWFVVYFLTLITVRFTKSILILDDLNFLIKSKVHYLVFDPWKHNLAFAIFTVVTQDLKLCHVANHLKAIKTKICLMLRVKWPNINGHRDYQGPLHCKQHVELVGWSHWGQSWWHSFFVSFFAVQP